MVETARRITSAFRKLSGVVLGIVCGYFLLFLGWMLQSVIVGPLQPFVPLWHLSFRDLLGAFVAYASWLGALFVAGAVTGSIAGEPGKRYGTITGILVAFFLGPRLPSIMEGCALGMGRTVDMLAEIASALLALAVLIYGVFLSRKGGAIGARQAEESRRPADHSKQGRRTT